MRRTVIYTASVIIMVGMMTFSAYGDNVTEANKPYVPTRLEWLATWCNARNSHNDILGDRFTIAYLADSKTGELLISVQYLPNVSREFMNQGVDGARYNATILAKSKGWDSWLKIKENIRKLSVPRSQ